MSPPVAGFEAIPADSPLSGPLWTWLVPVLLFAIATLATWALYRRFSSQPTGDDGEG